MAATSAPALRRLVREPVVGWLGPLLVTALAAYLRFHRLRLPHAVVFDETYYAKDALALLRFGYERATIEQANEALLGGNTDIWAPGPQFVVHPPLGKWLIALGECVFGATPFGWRFSAALVGSASVLVLARTARRMFGSTLLGCLAGLLLALDGLHLVQSRVAMLDVFLMFWIVAAFACLVADRSAFRARLARGLPPGARWWRLAGGACLGAALACKWSAAWYVVALGLLSLAWDIGARRAAGSARPFWATLRTGVVGWAAAVAAVPAAVYVASWTGWFLTDGGWDRQWANGRDSAYAFVPAVLRSWWHYHAEALRFHLGLGSPHPYDSSPWGWLLLARPVSYYFTSPATGCQPATKCASEVLALGTPAIWWSSVVALTGVVWLFVSRRDWRAAAALVGVAGGWLPWFVTPDRTMFFFYALPMLPFLVLALTLLAGVVLGPAGGGRRRAWGALAVGAWLLVAVVNFFGLYPILAAEVIPYASWQHRMWLPTWI